MPGAGILSVNAGFNSQEYQGGEGRRKMAAMTISCRILRFGLLQDGNVSASWGLPVEGVNFICSGVAQHDGRIIES
jgi:hypothetical protein